MRTPEASSPRPALISKFLAGALLTAALTAFVEERQPVAGEPLLVRWMRTLAQHPLRSTVALGLLLEGLSRPGKGVSGSSPGRFRAKIAQLVSDEPASGPPGALRGSSNAAVTTEAPPTRIPI